MKGGFSWFIKSQVHSPARRLTSEILFEIYNFYLVFKKISLFLGSGELQIGGFKNLFPKYNVII